MATMAALGSSSASIWEASAGPHHGDVGPELRENIAVFVLLGVLLAEVDDAEIPAGVAEDAHEIAQH